MCHFLDIPLTCAAQGQRSASYTLERMNDSAISRRRVLALAGALGLLTGCGASGAPRESTLRLATGPEGAVYREIGGAIAEVIGQQWPQTRVQVRHTDAGWENVILMAQGSVDLALTNIDIIYGEQSSVLALGRLFDSVFHVIVPRHSEIQTLDDLDELRIACGQRLSGTRYMAETIFAETGIAPQLSDFSQSASMAALDAGEVDAVVSLTGMPTPALVDAAEHADYRLLPLGAAVDAVLDAHPMHYLPVTIPSSMYPGLGSVRTLVVPTLLVVDPGFDDDLATGLTGLVFDNAGQLSQAHPGAGQINVRTGSATLPVPLHPGATRWFQENKP